MKLFAKKMLACLLAAAMLAVVTGCAKTDTAESDTEANAAHIAVCKNGSFKGAAEEDTGILSFKGIPYAKAPVGELRWKAPEAPEDSTETYDATAYGKSGIQNYWHSENITSGVGEDCLTLNVWTDSLDTKDKAVMVFFPGGAFAWGGTSEPIYNGQYIVSEHKDVVVVSCNYRLGVMGFANFNGVEGAEEFPDSENLGLLDCLEALRWVKNNIAAFGGNPDNVTIFGESAGGTLCSAMMLTDEAGELFQHVIVQSGPIGLSIDQEEADERTDNVELLMEYTGAETMDDLMALTEEQLIEANAYVWEDGSTLNESYIPIVRGANPVPEDLYEMYSAGKAKNVDLMIGTTLDEINYWINEMSDEPLWELTEEEAAESEEIYNEYFIAPILESAKETISEGDYTYIEKYLALFPDMTEEEANSRLVSDLCFRASSIRMAEEHSSSDGTGNTYMYLFEKENTAFEQLKSCHAIDLPYVFHSDEDEEFAGKADEGLMDAVCDAWVNFAKTGNPTTETATWNEYDSTDRNTMVFGNDNTAKMVKDPYSEERQLLAPLVKYNIRPSGA